MTISYQPELFPDVDPKQSYFLPVADLLPMLRRAVACHGNLHELSRVIAARMGGSAKNHERLLFRIFSGKQTQVTFVVADRLSQSIGLHPMNVWPDQWGAA